MMNKECWIFKEYDDQKVDYPNYPFNIKIFYDFDEMKEYSANMSAENKPLCVDYCSSYVKTNTGDNSFPEILNSDYEQTINELIKYGNNMAKALKEINEKYIVVWEDGGESCPAYIQWKNLINELGYENG
jgi:hypothetical protein